MCHLCAGCRSSRTSTFSSNNNTYKIIRSEQHAATTAWKWEDMLQIKQDSLRIHIIEYYPSTDTSMRGSVKSETEIYYAAATKSVQATITKDTTTLSTNTIEEVTTSSVESCTEKQETKQTSGWKKIGAVSIIILLCSIAAWRLIK